jgi:ATP-dependent DNA helicase RecQ
VEAAIRKDSALRAKVRQPLDAIDRGLMFLHEQQAVILRQGLAVFRQAMTVELTEESKGKAYTKAHYEQLDRHYGEKVAQVHVMNEYARLALSDQRAAGRLVNDYFNLNRDPFYAKYFGGREEVLRRATGEESYRRIVDDLRNPHQIEVVTAPPAENMLVLAGPGSGKTRVVVHRCAYLLRVARVRPEEILILCFNHHAAVELRRRLADLIGYDARGVTASTYHGLAMRLTGTSFSERAERDQNGEIRFDEVLRRAVGLLRGEEEVPGIEPDELRDRLLAGYRYILVDEYQDIDQVQYELISAIAGRGERNGENRLSILAVGDDDQNIYTWRGANVRFLKQFEADYRAKRYRLLENYRSTRNIIEVANRFIAANRDRLKTGDPIRINEQRALYAAGGALEAIDPLSRGRVQRIDAADGDQEAAVVVAELRRLHGLHSDSPWSQFAVLCRTRDALHPIRAVLEHHGIPHSLVVDRAKAPPLPRIREIWSVLAGLRRQAGTDVTASALAAQVRTDLDQRPGHPWLLLLHELLLAWQDETGNVPQPAGHVVEFLYEALVQRRRESRLGEGVYLGTVHSAKGMEFRQVVMPSEGWGRPREEAEMEEERRVFYVGMTRARELLTFTSVSGTRHPHLGPIDGDEVLSRVAGSLESVPDDVRLRRYELLGPGDLFLDLAGHRPGTDGIHARLAQLDCGAGLSVHQSGEKLSLRDAAGAEVARLSADASGLWSPRLAAIECVRVVAMVRRRRADTGEDYRERMMVDEWEVPVCEVSYREPSRDR